MFYKFGTKEYFMKRNLSLFFCFAIIVMVAIFTIAACDPGNSPPTTYQIGDTGPAGGIVFYEKGTTSGDWRYLEATPVSAILEPTNWVPYDSEFAGSLFGGTSTAIGSGKRNTEIILEKLHEWGAPTADQDGREVAAKLCADLEYGGKSDWFLPSKDELNQMYLQRAILNVDSLDDVLAEKRDYSTWENLWKKPFWSSSESDDGHVYDDSGKLYYHVWQQEFGNSGYQWDNWQAGENLVWAVRAF
jgi:hypothetical protein